MSPNLKTNGGRGYAFDYIYSTVDSLLQYMILFVTQCTGTCSLFSTEHDIDKYSNRKIVRVNRPHNRIEPFSALLWVSASNSRIYCNG